MNAPKLNIEGTKLYENSYVRGGKRYRTADLVEMSKGLPIFDMPLAGVDIQRQAWQINDLDDFIFHMNRCKNADLKYPIIIDNLGVICDGLHRICKAIVLGQTSVKAVRLEEMPHFSEIKETNNE